MSRLRREDGITMIEVVVAMGVALFVVLGVHLTLDKGTRSALGGERQAVALGVAEREIERVRQVVAREGFAALALSSAPAPAPSAERTPSSPAAFLDGASGTLRWTVKASYKDAQSATVASEPLVVDPARGRLAPVSTGVTSGAMVADVHRFVSERTELCATGGNCTGQSRRVTVAVVLRQPGQPEGAAAPAGSAELLTAKPVYLSTVLDDAVPHEAAQAAAYGLRVGVDLP